MGASVAAQALKLKGASLGLVPVVARETHLATVRSIVHYDNVPMNSSCRPRSIQQAGLLKLS